MDRKIKPSYYWIFSNLSKRKDNFMTILQVRGLCKPRKLAFQINFFTSSDHRCKCKIHVYFNFLKGHASKNRCMGKDIKGAVLLWKSRLFEKKVQNVRSSLWIKIHWKVHFKYIYIYISSSSSCRAASTDIPDPLSPLLPIIQRLSQVFRATSRILT